MGFGNIGVTGSGAPPPRGVAVTGDEMTGPLILARDPQAPREAVTRNYVDQAVALLTAEIERLRALVEGQAR